MPRGQTLWGGYGKPRLISPLGFRVLSNGDKIVSNDSTSQYADITIKTAGVSAAPRDSDNIELEFDLPPQPGEPGANGGDTPGIVMFWLRALNPADPDGTPNVAGIPDGFGVIFGLCRSDASPYLYARGLQLIRSGGLLRGSLVTGGNEIVNSTDEFPVAQGIVSSSSGASSISIKADGTLEQETQGAVSAWDQGLKGFLALRDLTGSDVATRLVFDMWMVSTIHGNEAFPDVNSVANRGYPWLPR